SQPVKDSQAAAAMSDTVLRGATEDEIVAIVAHELAHAKYHDVLTRAVSGALRLSAMMCGLYLLDGWGGLLSLPGVGSITEPKATAWLRLILTLGGSLLGPGALLMPGRAERRADLPALELTNAPAAVESVWRHIVEVNLADPRPGRLTHLFTARHPSLVE